MTQKVTITTKVPPELKHRFESLCNRNGVDKSPQLMELIQNFVDRKDEDHVSKVLVERIDRFEESLAHMAKALETLCDAVAEVRQENRRDLASYFKVILRNPHLLPDKKLATKENVRNILDKMGMGEFLE